MKERAIQIISLLIRNKDYKISNIEKELSLTRRQINYSLNKINETFRSHGLPIIERTPTGNFIIPNEIIQLFATEQNLDMDSNTYFTDLERVDFILLYLIISGEMVSLNHLIDMLKVSKNTVLSDLNNVEDNLNLFDLNLSYSRKEGYIIDGEEKNVRVLLNDIIRRNILYKRVVPFEQSIINKFEDEVIHMVRMVEKNLKVRYSDESFKFLIEVMKYNFARINSEKSKELNFKEPLLMESHEFKIINRVDNLKLNQENKLWFTLLLISSNIYTNAILNSGEYNITDTLSFKLEHLITEMVDDFQNRTLILISNRDSFERRLLNHLRPAVFRIQFDIKVNDYSLEVLKQEDDLLIRLIQEIIHPLEEFIGKKIPDDELRLLSLYFGMQLNRNEELPEPKKRAVVVCSNGLIVSKLMQQLLRRLFPEMIILNSLSVREFNEFQNDYDLVFTSIPLKTKLKQYIINPLMTSDEQLELRKQVLSDYGMSELNEIVENAIVAAKEHGSIYDVKGLRKKFEKILITNNAAHDYHEDFLPGLNDYLNIERIQIAEGALSWREAIQLSFKPFLEKNMLEQSYVEETISQFETGKVFHYFGTKMAIPHCDRVQDLKSEGIGLLISKTPIQFPNNMKINLIAPMAIIDTTRHLKAVNKLAEIAQNDTLTSSIILSNDIKKIYRLLGGK
ncbi:BglG family transcription antiterminator [Facklamia miroungae]|uniref:Transcriptional antiterminator n=1 Tax=Facklamia miroungae TaxID=120956 RepID=A0A1G7RW62_9LACT|nr:BglG family transcription antiterminator [Facklamia miroungae]NKZ29253.1 BglG family transcription antiterminator [Facklamia miroungae]SDG14976.1 Transcriptional antiterminator [Facklamia miroungae]